MEKYGKMFGTDKITHHKYHNIYSQFIEKFENINGSMIEIGIQEFNSLQMWLNLFKNIYVYGFDKNIEINDDRYNIFKGDQSNEEDLNKFTKIINKPVYFINDDGSHIPEHQILTFNKLFPCLEEGGIYIIEDIETSYWTKGCCYDYETRYGYKNPKSTIEIFKNIIDCVNYKFLLNKIETPIEHLDNIKMISFTYNCIIIEKKNKDEDVNKYNYPFSCRL